jgi:hypothetical protein
MKLVAIALAVLVFGTSIAGAPAIQKKPNPDADRIALKIRRIEILDQLLPVLMTKDQLKKLLPEIEKARQTELDIQKSELDEMKGFEPKLDEALEAAIKEQKLPKDEFVVEYLKMFSKFSNKRKFFMTTSAKAIVVKMKEVMNVGQLKTAEVSLDPRLFGEKDPEAMTSDEKLVLWAREVLLDRASYDLLVDMSL